MTLLSELISEEGKEEPSNLNNKGDNNYEESYRDHH